MTPELSFREGWDGLRAAVCNLPGSRGVLIPVIMKLNSIHLLAAALMLAALVLTPSPARAEDPAPNTPPPDKAPKAQKGERPARPGGEQAEGARVRRDAAMAELGLTDEQRDKLRAAQKDQSDKAKAIREDSSLSREQKTAKVRELRDSFNASAKTIMTADQYEKWQKMQEARRTRTGRPNPGQPAPGPAPTPAK